MSAQRDSTLLMLLPTELLEQVAFNLFCKRTNQPYGPHAAGRAAKDSLANTVACVRSGNGGIRCGGSASACRAARQPAAVRAHREPGMVDVVSQQRAYPELALRECVLIADL